MSRSNRVVASWLQEEKSAVSPMAPRPPVAAEDPVFIPAHPEHPPVNQPDLPSRTVVELLQGPFGPVPVAFSSLDLLVERLGESQPWVALPAAAYVDTMRQAGFGPVHLDPPIDPAARRWTPQDIAEYGTGT